MPLRMPLGDCARTWVDTFGEEVLRFGELDPGAGQRQARVSPERQAARPVLEVIDPDEALYPARCDSETETLPGLIPDLISGRFRPQRLDSPVRQPCHKGATPARCYPRCIWGSVLSLTVCHRTKRGETPARGTTKHFHAGRTFRRVS